LEDLAKAHRLGNQRAHVWTASALQGKFGLNAISGGCGHVSGLLTRHAAAGPDEIRGSGLNQIHAVCPHTPLRGVPIPGSTGWHQVISTLANLCILFPGFS
jgi:hypothetical protein